MNTDYRDVRLRQWSGSVNLQGMIIAPTLSYAFNKMYRLALRCSSAP